MRARLWVVLYLHTYLDTDSRRFDVSIGDRRKRTGEIIALAKPDILLRQDYNRTTRDRKTGELKDRNDQRPLMKRHHYLITLATATEEFQILLTNPLWSSCNIIQLLPGASVCDDSNGLSGNCSILIFSIGDVWNFPERVK